MRRCVLVLALLALAPMSARADDTEPAFRIGGGMNLLTWTATTVDASMLHSESGTLTLGILAPSFGLDIGALVLPWLAFGVVGQVSYATHAPTAATSVGSEVLAYQALAYAEGSFRLDITRPFLRVYGGVSGSDTQPTSSVGPPGTAPVAASSTLVQGAVGGALGVHCFATSDFSISPYGAVLYMAGNGQSTSGATLTYSSQVVSFQLGVSFLGWID